MLMGHYGPALALRSSKHSQPLWVYVLLVQAADIVFFVLAPLGVEELRIRSDETGPLALDLVDLPVTHSFLGTIAVAATVGSAVAWRADSRVGLMAAAAFASHWLLDVFVHQHDLPIWPDGPTVGLGWWRPWQLGLTLELAVLVVGGAVLVRARHDPTTRRRYLILVGGLAGIQIVYVVLPPLEPVWVMALGAQSLYAGAALVAWWAERSDPGHRPISARARTNNGESSGSGIAS